MKRRTGWIVVAIVGLGVLALLAYVVWRAASRASAPAPTRATAALRRLDPDRRSRAARRRGRDLASRLAASYAEGRRAMMDKERELRR